MRNCTKCGVEKSSSEFAKDKYKKSGFKSCCKMCISTSDKIRNSLKPESILEAKRKYSVLSFFKEGKKKCSGCGSIKLIKYFKKRKDTITGLNAKCICCVSDQRKAYREENPEKIKSAKKEYYKNNREKISKKDKKYNKENKNKISASGKKYREANKEKIAEKNKKWTLKNKDTLSKKSKIYYESNKPKIAEYKKKYEKDKLLNDPVFKLTKNIRRRILLALEGKDKAESTLILLGCTIPELKEYLSNQFTVGMSWKNHSFYGWHIDHIRPCASFDLSDPSQQKKCFHYTNLQPLWAKDNLKKSASYKGRSHMSNNAQ